MRRRGWLVLIVPLLVLPSLGVGVTAGAAPAGTPRLELRAASPAVELFRYGRGDAVYFDLGVYVAALDAPFDLRVRRESYDDPVRVFQALHGAGGLDLVELPTDVLHGWRGLARFLRFEIYDREGTLIRRRVTTFCPGGWESQRVDDSGPFDPTYPTGCSSMPFTLGAVWGIDQGWAVSSSSGDRMKLRDGRYRAVVSFAPRYRTLFSIAEEDASVEIAVRVRTVDGCEFCGAAAPETQAAEGSLTAAPTITNPQDHTIPDLVALPAFWIRTSRQGSRDYLEFGSNVWNRGPANLVVEGFRKDGEDHMDAYQYFLDDGEIVGRAPAGSFEFDTRDGHHHWHFRQFASYRLLDASQATAVRSHKQSFCLAPTDAIDTTVEGGVWRTDGLGFSRCGYETSTWIREVLPTGWGDTYYQGVAGQSFNITGLPNGTYWIEVRANPLGVLYDGDPTNDVELREVILGGKPGARTVSVPPWHGIDTEG
jgi:Lysyl oxidase